MEGFGIGLIISAFIIFFTFFEGAYILCKIFQLAGIRFFQVKKYRWFIIACASITLTVYFFDKVIWLSLLHAFIVIVLFFVSILLYVLSQSKQY